MHANIKQISGWTQGPYILQPHLMSFLLELIGTYLLPQNILQVWEREHYSTKDIPGL